MSNDGYIGPIRITLKTYSREEIRRLNTELRQNATAWEENVESTVEKIRSIGWNEPIDEASLERWATHPDERVRIALVRSRAFRRRNDDLGTHPGVLVAKTDARFRPEYEVWNPVLDALAVAAADVWQLCDALNGGPAARASVFFWIAEKAVPRLRERGLLVEEAKRLLEFTATEELAAAIVGIVSPNVAFIEWLARNRPAHLAAFARRNDLDAETEEAIWQAALRDGLAVGSPVPAPEIIEALREKGRISRKRVAELLDGLEALKKSLPKRDVLYAMDRILLICRFDEGGMAEILGRFYRLVRRDQALVRGIVQHPQADAKLCAEIACDTTFHNIRKEIARRFGGSQAVRESLGTTTSWKILEKIAEHTSGEELIDVLDRLAKNRPENAILLLNRKAASGAIDGASRRAALERYFERLIAVDPGAALRFANSVARELGQPRVPVERVRAIARNLAGKDPVQLNHLNQLDGSYLAELEPEDWLPALEVTENRSGVARTLLRIPSATGHQSARDFILQHGGRDDVLGLLERHGLNPGEERLAAQAILRTCPANFNEVLDRWPQLKAALETEDLVAVLQSNDGAIRQKGILLLGEISKREEVRKPETEMKRLSIGR